MCARAQSRGWRGWSGRGGPTGGSESGAKAEVHRRVAGLAAAGMAGRMSSSERPEVLAMSDRVRVMREGQIVKELSRSEATPERVIAAATGQGLTAREGS